MDFSSPITGSPGSSLSKQEDDPPAKSTLSQRPYRSKKIQPCDLCRARKVACVIEEESSACFLCRRRNRECTFRSVPSRRARPARQQTAPTVANKKDNHLYNMKISFLRLETASRRLADTSSWFKHSTMNKGYTCFFSGSSGDQGPDLLRHLSFGDQNLFGSARWSAWRVLPRMDDPVYFTMFPNEVLDPHSELYFIAKIEQQLGHFEVELVNLYYLYVHPNYPILELKEDFIRRRQSGDVRASLMSCIYLHALEFWHRSEALRGQTRPEYADLWNHVFMILAVETRTPNLDTVRALLLYMQFPSHQVREPNRPGQWALSSLLVGVAQDIGLNIDPTDWNIPRAERKTRKVLWWAVYAHDKWMAHWLGRPAHFSLDSWNVRPIALEDFTDDLSRVNINSLNHVRVFIAFIELSTILDEVLQKFYTVRGRSSGPLIDDGIHAKFLAWSDGMGFLRESSPLTPNVLSLRIACHAVELSIMRGMIRYTHNETDEAMENTLQTIRYVIDTLTKMCGLCIDGLWPSYCAGNLQIIGSILISLCLSSIDDEMLDERSGLLLGFRKCLQDLACSELSIYETARLPLNRLNLVLDQIFEGRSDEAS